MGVAMNLLVRRGIIAAGGAGSAVVATAGGYRYTRHVFHTGMGTKKRGVSFDKLYFFYQSIRRRVLKQNKKRGRLASMVI